jgi:HSP20 family protein
MNQLTRWNPFRHVARIAPFTDVDSFLRSFHFPSFAREYERTMDMRMDVSDDDNAYTVEIDMPGVKKEAIDVSIDRNQVTVRAEVEKTRSWGKDKALCSERFSGQAFRSFSLPSEVDRTQARAAYDGGVLTLTLPKKAGAAQRLAVS